MSYIESKNSEFIEKYKKKQSLNNIEQKTEIKGVKSEIIGNSEYQSGKTKKRRIFNDDDNQQKIVSLQMIPSQEHSDIINPVQQMNDFEEIKQIIQRTID